MFWPSSAASKPLGYQLNQAALIRPLAHHYHRPTARAHQRNAEKGARRQSTKGITHARVLGYAEGLETCP